MGSVWGGGDVGGLEGKVWQEENLDPLTALLLLAVVKSHTPLQEQPTQLHYSHITSPCPLPHSPGHSSGVTPPPAPP